MQGRRSSSARSASASLHRRGRAAPRRRSGRRVGGRRIRGDGARAGSWYQWAIAAHRHHRRRWKGPLGPIGAPRSSWRWIDRRARCPCRPLVVTKRPCWPDVAAGPDRGGRWSAPPSAAAALARRALPMKGRVWGPGRSELSTASPPRQRELAPGSGSSVNCGALGAGGRNSTRWQLPVSAVLRSRPSAHRAVDQRDALFERFRLVAALASARARAPAASPRGWRGALRATSMAAAAAHHDQAPPSGGGAAALAAGSARRP